MTADETPFERWARTSGLTSAEIWRDVIEPMLDDIDTARSIMADLDAPAGSVWCDECGEPHQAQP
jgi:hypothetical protein